MEFRTDLSLPIKTALQQSKPNLSITHDDEAKKWEVNFSLFVDPIKVDAMKFDVGEEFDEKMPLGFTNKGRIYPDSLSPLFSCYSTDRIVKYQLVHEKIHLNVDLVTDQNFL